DDVLHLSRPLVDLALTLQFVVVGQVAGRFLHPALGLIELSTHGGLLSGCLSVCVPVLVSQNSRLDANAATLSGECTTIRKVSTSVCRQRRHDTQPQL